MNHVLIDKVMMVAGAAALAALVLWIWRLRARAARAERGERLAVERRDRFLVAAAGELAAPIDALRSELAALTSGAAGDERLGAVAVAADQLGALVAELAELPTRAAARLDEIDLPELVREIVAAPPFCDRGPSVEVRASATTLRGDRARLVAGLRVLLWVVRREVDEREPLVITISQVDDRALVEIDARGGRSVAEALERMPAFGYGLCAAASPPGTTLALRVAAQVAQAHGGRLNASARAQGERFVLDLPIAATT